VFSSDAELEKFHIAANSFHLVTEAKRSDRIERRRYETPAVLRGGRKWPSVSGDTAILGAPAGYTLAPSSSMP
jgi:hypothetical protein